MSILTRYAVPGALIGHHPENGVLRHAATDETMDMYVRFAYLMLFLIALFLGLDIQTRKSRHSIGHQIGNESSLCVCLDSLRLYMAILPMDPIPEYFEDRIDVVAKRPEAAGQEAEKALGTAEFIFSPFTHSTITLFGFMVIGFFYTIILVMIMRGKPEAFR
ncbi:MAG: hypothetical protein R2813_11230 [Flavobacteriales bacterium]